jgi:hypothetical protein
MNDRHLELHRGAKVYWPVLRHPAGQNEPMNLDAVADELYGLSLEDFIPTRNAREMQAKGAGDKALASEIHRQPKPNAVAWLVNQLVREHRDDIKALLELGTAMREATANLSGDRLRELSRRQHQVIRGLVQQAGQLPNAGGRQVSDDTARSLEETFYATLADPGAAAAIAAGRLTTGLHSTGFAGSESTGSQQPPSAKSKSPSGTKERPRTKERRAVQQHERAETRVAQAKSVVEAATKVRDEAHATLKQAEQSVADASDRVERLRRELHQAVEVQSKAQMDRRRAHTAFDRANRRARDAHRRLTDAAVEHDRSAR